jgi:hypothetical protein
MTQATRFSTQLLTFPWSSSKAVNKLESMSPFGMRTTFAYRRVIGMLMIDVTHEGKHKEAQSAC